MRLIVMQIERNNTAFRRMQHIAHYFQRLLQRHHKTGCASLLTLRLMNSINNNLRNCRFKTLFPAPGK